MGESRSVEVFEVGELEQLKNGRPFTQGLSALLSRSMAELGPEGPGLLAVRGVPALGALRHALLPFARLLALSPPSIRAPLLKEHGLGTDVPLKDPNRAVSSFVAQLKFGQALSDKGRFYPPDPFASNPQTWRVFKATENSSSCDHSEDNIENHRSVQELGRLFRELGEAMVEVGLLLARICDLALQNSGLEQVILESCTAKGRLIHYHALDDCLVLSRRSGSVRNPKIRDLRIGSGPTGDCSGLWQQWHFDYGIFTVLTAPMFLSGGGLVSDPDSKSKGVESPLGHSCLKILNPRSRKVEFVNVPNDCLVVQVGEAAQILTAGSLRATAHCVGRPTARNDVSRETYVVFLQPSWHKMLKCPDMDPSGASSCSSNCDKLYDGEITQRGEFADILCKIPPLKSRWKDGYTFADFSRETTKQYYGANGSQSNQQYAQC